MNFDYLFNSDLLVTGIKPVAGKYDGKNLSEFFSFEKDKIYSKCELFEMMIAVDNEDSQSKALKSYLGFLVECFYNSKALQEAVELGLIAEIIYDDSIHQRISDEKPKIPISGIKPVSGEFNGSDLSTVIKFAEDKYYSKDELVEMAKEMDECIDQFYDGAAFPHFINIVISDDRPCLEDFGSIEDILIDAAAFLRYLIGCFDDPDKLKEAQEKGYIVDVSYE